MRRTSTSAPETPLATRTYRVRAARLAAAALAGSAAIVAASARADPGETPLCELLSGIAESAQALADGNPTAAEVAARRAVGAAPRGAAGARAAAALGLALVAGGRPGEAAAPLARAAEAAAGPARAALERAQGDALLAAGRAEEAARVLAAAASGGDLALARAASWRSADALLAAGDARRAADALDAHLREDPGAPEAARARLSLAAALRLVGEADRAVALYRSIWIESPQAPEAALAAEALEHWRDAGGPVPPASGEDRLARAERLLAAGQAADALAELAAGASAAPPLPAHRAGALRALALLALFRHAEAEAVAAPLADDPRPEVRRTAELVLARAAARAGRLEEASALYARVAAETAPVPGLPEWRQRDLSDEAQFLEAWLFHDAGEYARAARLLDAFAREHPRSHRANDARWFAAWSMVRLGRSAEADRALAKLERGPLAEAALYWRARLARDPARRRALERAVAAADPSGWYGMLARARLAAAGVRFLAPPPPAPKPIAELDDGPAAARLRAAADLLGLGLRREALAEIADLARGARVRPVAAQAAELAAFAGDAELPFRMARDHLTGTRRAMRWSHPEAHSPLVRRAESLGVDPALLLSVMRRESSFRPDARSLAGAEGLLQLVPSTVERLAAVAGAPDGLPARLGDPDVAVATGAWYLALLLSRFGDPAAAVAAYNAGPRPVAAWTRDRAGMPLDAWVESIPWRETRQYVKVVLAQWSVYRALAGDPPPAVAPDRPVAPPRDGVAF